MFSVGFLRVAGFMVVRVSGVSMMIGEWGGLGPGGVQGGEPGRRGSKGAEENGLKAGGVLGSSGDLGRFGDGMRFL